MLVWKKKYILCLITGIFIFRILYSILDFNISYSLIISFIISFLVGFLIFRSKEGMTRWEIGQIFRSHAKVKRNNIEEKSLNYFNNSNNNNNKKAKYFKFDIIKNRGTNYSQLSKIAFYYNTSRIPFTGASASSNTGFPDNESPSNAISDNNGTKWLSFNPTSSLFITFPNPIFMTGYSFTTANDWPTRDPISWKLYSSNDGQNWVLIDTKEDYPTPMDRFTQTPIIPIPIIKITIIPVDEYKEDEQNIFNILNNYINPTLERFNNDFKRLDDLASSDTEDNFNEFLRDNIRPQLERIKSSFDMMHASLNKRSSDTRMQDDGNGGGIPLYNTQIFNNQRRQVQDIQSKINTYYSQINGFIQRIKQQNQAENVARTVRAKPPPPMPPQDEFTYIPPSSSFLSNYSNNKYINQNL